MSDHGAAQDDACGFEAPLSAVAAVQRMRERSYEWSALTVRERCRRLSALHDRIACSADLFAETIHSEIGKPLQEAYGADILPSLAALRWLAGAAPRRLASRRVTRNAFEEPTPFGVVGVIGTWNYPLFLNLAPIAWALAAGNAVVWKPSELASHTAAVLARLCEEIGLPVTVIYGGPQTGQELCRAGCDKYVFTGGRATGRSILTTLAATGTPSVMELSGCDPMLVCADADIAVAARTALWARCCNAGQSCVAPQRIFVHTDRYDEFVREAAAALSELRETRDYAPMRTPILAERVRCFIADALAKGACIAAAAPECACPEGAAPLLLRDCSPAMRIFQEDLFGPVLAVCPAGSIDSMVHLANENEMALAASVWTRDMTKGRRIASRIDAGMVSINELLLDAANPALPFGGRRGSGFGRQRGIAGLEEMVQWRVVVENRSRGLRRHLFPYRPATVGILKALIVLQSARRPAEWFPALRGLISAARAWQNAERKGDER